MEKDTEGHHKKIAEIRQQYDYARNIQDPSERAAALKKLASQASASGDESLASEIGSAAATASSEVSSQSAVSAGRNNAAESKEQAKAETNTSLPTIEEIKVKKQELDKLADTEAETTGKKGTYDKKLDGMVIVVPFV